MPDDPIQLEARLQKSWSANAQAWSDTVREGGIASRRAGTDDAIVDAVLETQRRRILDVGCGEGWLARALASNGCDVVGIDGSPELIASARALGGARFETLRYADLVAQAADLGRFDVVVFNFALLGADLATPLRAARELLVDDGRVIVQTVHPWTASADAPYRDGWRLETFAGLGSGFVEPMPWYFHTLASLHEQLAGAGLLLERFEEPVDAASGRPLSLILFAGAA